MRSRLQIVSQRVSARADNLTAISQLLEQRGIETSPYRQFVIRSTGQVTSDILDPEVLMGLAKELAGELATWLKLRGPTWFVRFLIVVSFVVLFRIVFRFIWWLIRITGRPPMSKLLSDLGGRTVGPMGTIVGVVAGLAFIGVNPTHLMAGMGVAGLIVGLALQDSMSNLAAGFFVLVYRPYDVDDVVSAGGVVGKVRAMGLASTTIVTFDNRRMHVPNRKIWQEVIENRSTERVRRAEATVRVGYERDIDRAIEVIHEVLAEYDAILPKPEGSVFVSRWADSWIEITVWGWAANADWWTATTELPRLIRNRFDAEGIEIPFPRRQIVEDDGTPTPYDDSSA
jgi:small conductance mechanosensitive channel